MFIYQSHVCIYEVLYYVMDGLIDEFIDHYGVFDHLI